MPAPYANQHPEDSNSEKLDPCQYQKADWAMADNDSRTTPLSSKFSGKFGEKDLCGSRPGCHDALAGWDIIASFENETSGELRVTVRFQGAPALILYRPHRYSALTVRNIRNDADAKLLRTIISHLPQNEDTHDTGQILQIWLQWTRSGSQSVESFGNFLSRVTHQS